MSRAATLSKPYWTVRTKACRGRQFQKSALGSGHVQALRCMQTFWCFLCAPTRLPDNTLPPSILPSTAPTARASRCVAIGTILQGHQRVHLSISGNAGHGRPVQCYHGAGLCQHFPDKLSSPSHILSSVHLRLDDNHLRCSGLFLDQPHAQPQLQHLGRQPSQSQRLTA